MDFHHLDISETSLDFRSGFVSLTSTYVRTQRAIEEQAHPDQKDALVEERDLCLERMSLSFIATLRGARSPEDALPLFHWIDYCFPHSPDISSPTSRWKKLFLAHSFLFLLGRGKPSLILGEIRDETAAGTKKTIY